MHSLSRSGIKAVTWAAAAMVGIVVFRIGGPLAHTIGQFSPLAGAFIGASLTLFSAVFPRQRNEKTETWVGLEQLSWILIGSGILVWAVGESFWRYSISIGQMPFPSTADIGYSLFPPLAFIGLLLQPAPDTRSKRIVLLMDSLIAMGSILAIAWYLLLGTLAQAPGEANLAKFLGLYYPTSDTALLSCIVFLLLQRQGRAYQSTPRRVGLILVGIGMCFFVASDFLFNIQQNAGTYVEATWVDLGWPLGMMTIGIAAYLRRFLPATPQQVIQNRMEQRFEDDAFHPLQFVPYGLLGVLFLVLTLDVLTSDAGQKAIRPVLLFATLSVVGLVVLRQILTLQDNLRLTRQQAEALDELQRANWRIEEQSRQVAERTLELEHGIDHLKNVQASIANGNLRARATLSRGALLPLAGSLNLMAERLARMEQVTFYAQHLVKALGDLSVAFEQSMTGAPFVIPASCKDLIEINRLLVAMRLKSFTPTSTLRMDTDKSGKRR